jgi:hypothetical protein
MLKIVAIATIGVLPFLLNVGEAKAQRGAPIGGYGGSCPIGTCGLRGGPRTTNIKNCRAANCPKGSVNGKPLR